MPYKVQLKTFEGPLDLLLYLIRKNEVDIYDIPVAEITRQYLEYLEVIKLLDLDNAGDFILMAATLIRIKAQMLMPRPEMEEEEEEDPRAELVRRLLEYKRFKEVAQSLSKLEKQERNYFIKSTREFDFEIVENEEENPFGEVTLFDLMSVFKEVMKKLPEHTHYTVEQIPVTLEDQAEFIMQVLEEKSQVLFSELLSLIKERLILIVTFIALLELVKNKRIQLTQNEPFADIWIRKV
ncbi:MAG: hypothetical protein D6813_00020 [Calditrichaeota bacterium]|nr:MAG: hypothetical protein D6813_00020 [Calditrichota bacterium]